jgi:methylated-DNA-[protein]-cysteine S-methyltransferase
VEEQLDTLIMEAPFGSLIISAKHKAIISIETTINKLMPISTNNAILQEAKLQMAAYFNGSLQKFNLPLAFNGSSFQNNCWQQLCTIPYGKTISYAQQAQILKNPKGIRAIASSNGKNKIAIIIPCHRVIGSNGSLTGYAGGIAIKKWLLTHEALHSGAAMQQSLF